MLAEERARLHPLPRVPHTVCFGQTRKLSWQSTISVGGALYSVPRGLVDERVWARSDGDELVIVHVRLTGRAARGRAPPADHAGAAEHPRAALPAQASGALERRPKASTLEEQAFLVIGPGAAE